MWTWPFGYCFKFGPTSKTDFELFVKMFSINFRFYFFNISEIWYVSVNKNKSRHSPLGNSATHWFCQHRFKTLNFSFKAGAEVTTTGTSAMQMQETNNWSLVTSQREKEKLNGADQKNGIGTQSPNRAFLLKKESKPALFKAIQFLISSFLLPGSTVNVIETETGRNLPENKWQLFW